MKASTAHWKGHAEPETTLLRAFQARRLHHGWLLAGPEGIGKRSFALAAAAHLLTRSPDHRVDHFDGDMDSPSGRLLLQDKHPDCHYITLGPKDDKEARKAEDGKPFETARNIKVDQIRSLQKRLTVRPSLADRRVIIFDSADLMERNAANALLKSLEEPPADTVFLLIAHNPGRLLPTLSFAGLDMAKIDALLSEIADHGDGTHRARLALGALVANKANRDRFQALLAYAPRFAARRIRDLRDERLPGAIAAWQEIGALASRAVVLNLDASAVAFQIGSLLARLAPPR
ncbi:hypothetical protein [Blastomonas sp. CCH11-A4]|uniref:hypothetical protein n=1 Tax=Blastomonas sp. CCH11-A4 TaxID=1768782 RepID=UPI000825C31A|nr:hypothetical protein [Blastomonas sp. CCH11-A4]